MLLTKDKHSDPDDFLAQQNSLADESHVNNPGLVDPGDNKEIMKHTVSEPNLLNNIDPMETRSTTSVWYIVCPALCRCYNTTI